ncbi:unnamed protein product [Protopolystoma xenopodis]|uniref:Uncharacterized protein n=1 Tax=Protopolystoma xenopodis TaxID=117903 RepID=A0A448XNK0_9PLAT|nr:unnamed protein product [Protopolystoma xenopodis]
MQPGDVIGCHLDLTCRLPVLFESDTDSSTRDADSTSDTSKETANSSVCPGSIVALAYWSRNGRLLTNQRLSMNLNRPKPSPENCMANHICRNISADKKRLDKLKSNSIQQPLAKWRYAKRDKSRITSLRPCCCKKENMGESKEIGGIRKKINFQKVDTNCPEGVKFRSKEGIMDKELEFTDLRLSEVEDGDNLNGSASDSWLPAQDSDCLAYGCHGTRLDRPAYICLPEYLSNEIFFPACSLKVSGL